MVEHLRVSRTLSLPTSSVTSTFGLLAVRGAGKSNAGRVLAEEMFKANLPFCAIDPVGSWYGLRAGRDGKPRGGLPVFIFGGEHGDVEITRGSGVVVADTIVNQRLASVVDLSGFADEQDKQIFLLDFARRLYFKNKNPLHLFMEEADDYIPQKTKRGSSDDLKRAWETIVRRGRGRGLGMTIMSQRSAVVNKDVLTQVETLFVLRTTGPQDLKQVEAWVKYHSVDDSMLESLASLEDGEAWVWSPHFLKKFERFRFRQSHTFDSGATPKNFKGRAARKVATLRDVNVKKLKGQIAETIEKSNQENPVHLRHAIAQLKAEVHNYQVEIERMKKKQPRSFSFTKLEKTAARMHADVERLSAVAKTLASVASGLEKSSAAVVAELTPLQNAVRGVEESKKDIDPPPALSVPKGRGVAALIPPKKVELTTPVAVSPAKVLPAGKSILQVLAQRAEKGATMSQLALLTGYSSKSGYFKNTLGALRTNGLITGPNALMKITNAGLVEAGPIVPYPKGRSLLEFWGKQLGTLSNSILVCLYNVYPNSMSQSGVAVAIGKSPTSGYFKNTMGKLRTLELISGTKECTLSEVFFE